MSTELVWLTRIALGTIFVASGLLKALNWRRFRDTLSAMELIPTPLIGKIALCLPPFEFFVGTSVVFQFGDSISVVLLVGLLLSFIFVLSLYRLRGGKELVCGCFADFDRKSSTVGKIIENTILLGLVCFLFGDAETGGHYIHEWICAGSVAIGLWVLWTLLNRLVETVMMLRMERLNEESW